jgi:hypothetical protein
MDIFIKKKQDLSIILNCILVNENIRHATLIHEIDDKKKKQFTEEIKKLFPNLIVSSNYEKYRGLLLVSKTNYNGRKDISSEELIKITGNPCYKDYNNISDDDYVYEISIKVDIIDLKYPGPSVVLFKSKCKDDSIKSEFENIANQANNAFKKEEYREILKGFTINKVYVSNYLNIPTQAIINKLVKNEKLDENISAEIMNILYNLGFTIEFQNFFEQNFQYNNPIHKGILLGLLLNYKHNLLSPFFPLQNYPVQSEKVTIIQEELEKNITKLLLETKQSENRGGKKTKYRKRSSLKNKSKKRK